MLNSPNEWHNEEDLDDVYADDGTYTDFGDDDEYYEDMPSDDNMNSSSGSYDDSAEEFEESEEDEEEYEEDNGSDNSKKTIIIGAAVLLIFLLLGGGIFGLMKNGKKNVSKETVALEQAADMSDENSDELSVDGEGENLASDNENEDEISIEVEGEENNNNPAMAKVEGEDEAPAVNNEKQDNKLVTAEEESGLKVEVEEENPAAFANKPGDGTVTISIGDVGRKNPFAPIGSMAAIDAGNTVVAKKDNYGVDFEVIEPPQLEAENDEIAKLLNTKVAGILYDSVRPSAIINIEGIDQLIRIGDVISGFEIIAITRDKVIIQSENNVFRASVGQPLNAEKIENSVEIANLRTKFWGSDAKHRRQ